MELAEVVRVAKDILIPRPRAPAGEYRRRLHQRLDKHENPQLKGRVEMPQGGWVKYDAKSKCRKCDATMIVVPKEGHPDSHFWENQRGEMILIACPNLCPSWDDYDGKWVEIDTAWDDTVDGYANWDEDYREFFVTHDPSSYHPKNTFVRPEDIKAIRVVERTS